LDSSACGNAHWRRGDSPSWSWCRKKPAMDSRPGHGGRDAARCRDTSRTDTRRRVGAPQRDEGAVEGERWKGRAVGCGMRPRRTSSKRRGESRSDTKASERKGLGRWSNVTGGLDGFGERGREDQIWSDQQRRREGRPGGPHSGMGTEVRTYACVVASNSKYRAGWGSPASLSIRWRASAAVAQSRASSAVLTAAQTSRVSEPLL